MPDKPPTVEETTQTIFETPINLTTSKEKEALDRVKQSPLHKLLEKLCL